jgi:hypothetical protein
MSRGDPRRPDHPSLAVPSPEVREFMAARRTPRPKATKKILDITRRLVEAEPPLDRMRTLWVFGSYARGAPDVGDLDLLGQIDDERTPGKEALDSYYRRAHPYAEVVRALGCGGGSMASLVIEPVFQPAREPISPERAATVTSLDGFEVPRLPPYGHIVTGDLFEPQPQLLWVRGDHMELVQERLRQFPSDPSARRLERTTTVPLLDELLPLLGVETGFQLAAQLRAGNLSVRAFILEATAPPPECAEMLDMRYTPASTRRVAGAAALAHMQRDGFDLGAVLFCDGPALSYSDWNSRDESQRPRAAIDFNPFVLYKLAAGDYPQDWTHLHVWPSPRRGRWLAVEVRVLSSEGSRELYHRLHRRLFTGERGQEARYPPIREALGMPPLPPPTPLQNDSP